MGSNGVCIGSCGLYECHNQKVWRKFCLKDSWKRSEGKQMESLWCGVPIATWPIYAEQQMNAFRMVREFGLAVELRLDFRNGDLVMTDEITTAVTHLMEGDSELSKKLKEMSEMARKAVAEGGSSFTAVGKFVNDIPRASSCDS